MEKLKMKTIMFLLFLFFIFKTNSMENDLQEIQTRQDELLNLEVVKHQLEEDIVLLRGRIQKLRYERDQLIAKEQNIVLQHQDIKARIGNGRNQSKELATELLGVIRGRPHTRDTWQQKEKDAMELEKEVNYGEEQNRKLEIEITKKLKELKKLEHSKE